MWRKIKAQFDRFWEWLFWRSDSDMSFDNSFTPADSHLKSYFFIILLAIIIFPIIYFVIWLDAYFK